MKLFMIIATILVWVLGLIIELGSILNEQRAQEFAKQGFCPATEPPEIRRRFLELMQLKEDRSGLGR